MSTASWGVHNHMWPTKVATCLAVVTATMWVSDSAPSASELLKAIRDLSAAGNISDAVIELIENKADELGVVTVAGDKLQGIASYR